LPSFGGYQKDIARDIATMVEATMVGEEDGKKIEDAELSDVGVCENIIISRDASVIT